LAGFLPEQMGQEKGGPASKQVRSPDGYICPKGL
jgi:hypothetical protein